ncbi:phospholipase C, phosphocholine-specific [Caulobacter segnis]|uniref:phosphocholine-specific phospholipase C n=1 Tax=Caulobacter segnis TaxID=88688 RepID=UPI00240F9087|nr:phospholipase C, phosphocholine-specific [Caulobacter segnis]MDG2520697.1 phospholipase C, phosphocholine-specific [Caulobacter segnis]
MSEFKMHRRGLIAGLGAAAAFPSIARALTIAPRVRTGTIRDVEHVVILMQENRSFDHYFGTMAGVRGYGDPHPAPAPTVEGRERNVFLQRDAVSGGPEWLAPFALNTRQTFAHMRVEGTPHSWPDAQAAWDEGRMGRWPEAKQPHSMGHYDREDIPFQYALAEAFTLCDGYFCSVQTGTNPNRVMLWSGTIDGSGERGGPCIGNSHDTLPKAGESLTPYRWTTYVERLQAAGVDWRVYQDLADNFTDNPLVGFESFQKAAAGAPGSDPLLAQRGLTTRALDGLKADVLAGRLPQVSYVIATATGSEHPGPSSPAQGAAYTARVIDALTADPEVWARSVLLVNFDENDGFFDHVPPPAPPGRGADGALQGGSTVDLTGEHHLRASKDDARLDLPAYRGRPYGLGPRVPMYVVSPWSRGGRVSSEVFDHTSVIRFLEARFDVVEPNISPWRRAVCGDLTSCFDFTGADPKPVPLPSVQAEAERAAALSDKTTTPPTPRTPVMPVQAAGFKPACPSPYDLECEMERRDGAVLLTFVNKAARAAVFHVYDRTNLEAGPRRYTVEGGKRLKGEWAAAGGFDLQVMGPDGFHRRFAGSSESAFCARLEREGGAWFLALAGEGRVRLTSATGLSTTPLRQTARLPVAWSDANHRYDLAVELDGARFEFAGRAPAL